MDLLSKLFRSKTNISKGPPEQEVVVHFFYGSTNYQHVYALEDMIRNMIVEAGVGKYDGHEVAEDGSDGSFFLHGPDAEALYRVISPLLSETLFLRGANVTLWFGPRKWGTPKRVINLPS